MTPSSGKNILFLTQRYQINVQNIMYKKSFKRGRRGATGKRTFGSRKKFGRIKKLNTITVSRGGIRV